MIVRNTLNLECENSFYHGIMGSMPTIEREITALFVKNNGKGW